MRTLLLGLDGVSWAVLEDHLEAGRLPNLARLFDRGVCGDLQSQLPPWTPSAWPSIYTGVNPGQHGVFDFLTFEGYDWDLVNRTHVDEYALWELLDQRGHSSVIVNVPVTEPPRAFDGALVPGYVGAEEPRCHPEGLLETLQDELGDYRVYAPQDVPEAGDAKREWYRRLVEMRGDAFRYLVEQYDPAFGFLQFQQTDTVFHERPTDDEAVRTVFEAVDEQVGATLEACDPDTVFVVSDHGIGPYGGYEFRVNEFLRDLDLLKTTTGEGSMPSWTALAREREDQETGSSLVQWLLRHAASVGVTSQRLQSLLSRLHLDHVVLSFVSTDSVRAASERVDFEQSTAYMRSRTELGIRINTAGRDPDGTVSPSEFEAVRDDIVRELSGVETPDGDPLFEAVIPNEECFSGPHIDEGVDILLVPAAFDHLLSASLRGDVFAELEGTWNHKRMGVIAAAGDGVDASVGVDDAHLFDVAPTVLASLGIPPSTRMEGEQLPFVAHVAPEPYEPFVQRAQRETGDRAVEARLADLGYLDDTNEY